MADEFEAARLHVENHELRQHRTLEERLAACEAALGEHGGRLDGIEGRFAAHEDTPIEIVVDDSPDTEIDVAESDDGAQADIAEAEDAGDAGAGE